MKTQKDIENENLQVMITKGINELLQAKENGTISELKQSGAILPYYVGELANKLKMYSDEVLMGRAKVKALPAKMLTILDPLVVSHYTANAMFSAIGRNTNFVKIAMMIGHALETEYKLILLEKKDEDLYKKFVNYIQGTNYKNNRQFKVTNSLLSKFHADIAKNNLSFYKLGAKALQLLTECQPIVRNQITPPMCYISESKGVETSIKPAKWVQELLFDMITNNDGAILPEYHTPLIEKPIDWTSTYGGGFHTDRFKYPLIRTEVDRDEFTKVPHRTLEAINRLQGTKWQVNKKILEVMSAASESDLGWGDLPTTYTAKDYLTPCPHGDVDKAFLTEEQKADRKLWREQSAPHYAEQESRNSKVLAMKRVLIEAKRFQDYPEIYFAYFADFRGRLYPKASNLHPQGTDYVKALLQFSEGKPIDTYEAEKYFFMHGANTFGHGLDKKTLVEKRKWVLDNKHEIIKSAENPYDLSGLWHKSDEEPWLFLAFCFEFKDYMTQDYANPTFVSHLPIAFDGSCNGLQHLSAILLDEVGGEAVNLTAKPFKQDIYDLVRVKTEKLLEANSEPLAADLLKFGITRKACKRPVMIVPYAGTQRACRAYIAEQIDKEGAREAFGDNYADILTLYTSTVWEAINQTIVKGREVMNFLKSTAKIILTKDGGSTITWTTPNGFEVRQKITKTETASVKTPLGNEIKSRGYIQNKVYVKSDICDVRRHSTAIAPNLVHSLDACHLQETVNHMPLDTSFAMIHDSYGCHAADAATLNSVLRDVFLRMYKDGDYLDKWLEAQGLELDAPERGRLDLSLVLIDEFFFS